MNPECGDVPARQTGNSIWATTWENQRTAYAKTKTQISFAVTAKLISAFVFASWIVQIPLLPKYKISSLYPSPVVVQPGLCQTWSKSTLLVFSCCGSFAVHMHEESCVMIFVSFSLNVPVNNFSVMSWRSHLGVTSSFWGVNVSCSRTQHGTLSEDPTPNLSLQSPTLHLYGTVLPAVSLAIMLKQSHRSRVQLISAIVFPT